MDALNADQKTLNGGTLTAYRKFRKNWLDNAIIGLKSEGPSKSSNWPSDVECDNGIIQAIDTVLVPGAYDKPAAFAVFPKAPTQLQASITETLATLNGPEIFWGSDGVLLGHDEADIKEAESKSEMGGTASKSITGRAQKGSYDNTKSMVGVSLGSNQEKIAQHEEAFSKIQAATGICDIDELVQNFINAEDQNFTLFKYNNELSADIEKLDQQIADYKEEYTALSGSGTRKEDTDKVKILETLEEKWSDIDKKAVTYYDKYQDANQTLTHIRQGIESIFRRVGCSIDDLPSGTGTTISEVNMMTFMAAIEHR